VSARRDGVKPIFATGAALEKVSEIFVEMRGASALFQSSLQFLCTLSFDAHFPARPRVAQFDR